MQQGAQGSFVWIVGDDGKTRFQPVKVGSWLGDQWFITAGVEAGDQVIVDGALKVRAGIPVTATPYVAAESPAQS